ncbi:MAG: hypothetical protein AAF205_00045 [Pseudomonadota bacterium]
MSDAKVGRPSKYDPAYCDQLEAFCADGLSVTAFAGHIGVSRSTLTNWTDEHPEFLAAVERAKAKRALAWELMLINTVRTGKGGTSAIFGVKNTAPDDWKDKTETEHSGAVETRLVYTGVPPKEKL